MKLTADNFLENGHKIGDLRVLFAICNNAEVRGCEGTGSLTPDEEAHEAADADFEQLLSAGVPAAAVDFDGLFCRWNGGIYAGGCIRSGPVSVQAVRVAEACDDEDESTEIVVDWSPTLADSERDGLYAVLAGRRAAATCG